MTGINQQVRLKSRPVGIPQREHFEIRAEPVPVPGPGQVLVRNHYLAVEPAMRGWVNAAGNYAEPVPVGAVMRAFAAGRVEQSNAPGLPVGTPSSTPAPSSVASKKRTCPCPPRWA